MESEVVTMQTANLLSPKVWRTFFWLLLAAGSAVAENQVFTLWPNGAPGSEGKTSDETERVNENGEHIVSSIHRPSVTLFSLRKVRPPERQSSLHRAADTVSSGWITKATTSPSGWARTAWPPSF
jgi:hypothetical protein